MNRMPEWKFIAVAGITLIVSLMMLPKRCQAQQAGQIQTVPEAGIRTASAAPAVSSQDANALVDSSSSKPSPSGGFPQGGGSLTARVQTKTRFVPLRESRTTVALGTKYVRGVVGGLEQGASIGLGVQVTTADLLHAVEFRATAITSIKLYRRLEGEVYFPKVFSENTHVDLWFDYLRRTEDNFFGIGPQTPTTSMTSFDVERRSYNAALYHTFDYQVTIGGFFRFGNSSTYRGQRKTDVPIDHLFSGDPNTVPVSNWAPGLLTNVQILSYGGFVEFDNRNRSEGLTKGAFFYGRVGSARSLKYKEVFSDYSWLDSELDGRGYIPLKSNKTSLALRAYALLQKPRGGSQIPFYNLSFLGGRMYGRGYRDYRFRGNNLALGSVELRQTVWVQREDRGLDIFGFGDAGQVWGDNRSTTDPTVLANQEFNERVWKSSGGGGLQYRYSKSLAGRVEIGHSNQRNLVYFSISRGF
jgi:hypothetical protein